jgi:uncharacterized protein
MKTRARIVFDTNALISALILQKSISNDAVQIAIERFDIIVSRDTWLEFETRIQKASLSPYFNSTSERDALVGVLNRIVEHIAVQSEVTDCRDADDNKFLSLALDGKASLLISGDKDIKTLHPWRGTSILSPGEFVREFGNT